MTSVPDPRDCKQLNRIYQSHPRLLEILNNYAPNLTVCPECRIDDFVHRESCAILAALRAERSSSRCDSRYDPEPYKAEGKEG